MTREQAIELARIHAKAQPQGYYTEPFQPHEWVISAILAAAPAEPTEMMLMAGQHATAPVKLETYQVAQVYKAMMGVALNVTNPDQDTCDPQQGLLNPANQVYFRAGLLACREYMARFVESENAGIAASIRANWWPGLGKDFGAPRKLEWDELTIGEYGEASFRARTTEEVSPTLEALPIALGFLGQKVDREPS